MNIYNAEVGESTSALLTAHILQARLCDNFTGVLL